MPPKELVTSLARIAGAEGQTPREFLQYVYMRVFREAIIENRINLELNMTHTQPSYIPPFVKLWLEGTHRIPREHLNGAKARI